MEPSSGAVGNSIGLASRRITHTVILSSSIDSEVLLVDCSRLLA